LVVSCGRVAHLRLHLTERPNSFTFQSRPVLNDWFAENEFAKNSSHR